MTKSFFILIITLISCSSAVKTASVSKHVSDVDTPYISKDSLLFNITSYNLSEDLTKNDELLIMAYWLCDSLPLETAFIKKQLIIDPDHMSRDFTWPILLTSEGKNMLLFFIEQDSETPIPQIDAILRIHHTDLIDAFNRHSYSDIETYLGD
ncbi:hypothetical protein [Fulvivirga sediminis]|uniref:Lipoprotein n=1 Tax=Fulvivirga sediminis TaxID=2803949 RepID=A0A937F3U3_9BACT|nr:hypothetical protein [Fulvivirga sediminis]MBL3654511.1 hypothetical protein [Fulvivirga sediminis]